MAHVSILGASRHYRGGVSGASWLSQPQVEFSLRPQGLATPEHAAWPRKQAMAQRCGSSLRKHGGTVMLYIRGVACIGCRGPFPQRTLVLLFCLLLMVFVGLSMSPLFSPRPALRLRWVASAERDCLTRTLSLLLTTYLYSGFCWDVFLVSRRLLVPRAASRLGWVASAEPDQLDVSSLSSCRAVTREWRCE